MCRSPRPLPPAPRPPFPTTYPPFYKQANDTQTVPPRSYDVQPPRDASYSRDRTHDIHQLLRSIREDLLEGMEQANALESRAGPWSSHNSAALATLKRAWARAFEASELLRTGEWAPRSRERWSPAMIRGREDFGRQRGPRRVDQRRAVIEHEESVSNAASDLTTRLNVARAVRGRDVVRRKPHSSPIPAYSPQPSWTPGPEQDGIEDGELDEAVLWLRECGEEATRERAGREEWRRHEAVRQWAEFDKLMAEIQAFERDYYRTRPGV